MLLSEAIEALLIATEADGRSPETVEAHRRKLKPFLVFSGDVPIESVTTDDLRRYVASQMGSGTLYADHPMHRQRQGRLSPHTVAGRVRSLKRLFNFLVQEGVLEVSPAKRIRTPRPREQKPKAVDFQDFLALLATCEGDDVADRRDRAVMLLLADTGCRIGGLSELLIEDVNLNSGFISLTEKGGKNRLVPFTETTAAALGAWLEVRPQDTGAWFFVGIGSRAKSCFTPGAAVQMLKRRAKRAKVTGRVNPHAFRHMFAREFLLNGGNLAILADLLGHSSVEVTKASYGIFTMADLKQVHGRYSPVARMRGENEVS